MDKPADRWKAMFKAAEKQHKRMLVKLDALEKEQEVLRTRESVLAQLSEGMMAILACISSIHHPEPSVNQHTCQLQPGSNSTVTAQLNSRDAVLAAAPASPGPSASLASGCSFGAGMPPMHSQEGCHLQQLESTIQSQLALIDGDGSMRAGQTFVSTKVLQLLFTPEQVDRVLSMSLDEIVLRLRHLAGKSAMMLLHDIDDPELWDMGQLLDTLAASMAHGQAPAAAGHSGHNSSHNSSHSSYSCSSRSTSSGSASGWPDPSQLGAAAGSSVGGRGTVQRVSGRSAIAAEATDAADCGPGSHGDALMLLSSNMHPAVEYILLVMTLMLWDEPRFHAISSMNLETMQQHCCMPSEHWQSVGRKLQLSADQLNTFALVKEVISTAFTALMARMRQTSEKQARAVQQQHADLCRMSQALQQQQQQQQPVQGPQQQQEAAPSHITLRQQQASQQESLTQQVLFLKHWRLLGLQQGICTLNTLSLRQLTAFCATSYPSISRIDLVLAAQAGSV